MSSAFPFRIPSIIPQDLQLIRDLIGDIAGSPEKSQTGPGEAPNDDDIDSSDSDTDSEREVEADILSGIENDTEPLIIPPPSDTASDGDSSSDSDDSDDDVRVRRAGPDADNVREDVDVDDQEETGPAISSESQARTKNEIADVEIMIPEVEEVGPHEALEKVGEVMSIVDNVVIVKGSASAFANRAAERALDSETLLVFDDRKVLGYIYETFGPTTQPLYQVKFNEKYPLDREKIQVARRVFHVPDRSNFVFVRQLRHFKGSDASNVHDEEPAEDELDFSDDEAEAAHKRALANRREQSRSRSVASSRHATPTPSQMRDQDMADEMYGENPYNESGPYNDMDFGAGPSRPAPIPYDDPYSDSYGVTDPLSSSSVASPRSPKANLARRDNTDVSSPSENAYGDRGRGRNRRNAQGKDAPGRRDDRGRGRGRGRDRPPGNRGRGRGRGRDDRGHWAGNERSRQSDSFSDEHNTRRERSLSPTSLAIARATGQYSVGSSVAPDVHNPPAPTHQMSGAGWGYHQAPYDQQFNLSFGYQNQYVQPHINPRFASNFGMGFGYQQAQYPPYGYGSTGYQGGGNSEPAAWNQTWSHNQDAPASDYGGNPETGQGAGS